MVHPSFIFLLRHGRMNSLEVHVRTHNLQLHWDKPEDAMNKLMTTALIAGGLLLLNSPEAAAHKEVRNSYHAPAYVYIDHRRADRMPRWLHRNSDFRHWYRHSPLRRDRGLAWFQLYDIFRFERRFGRTHYRSGNDWRDYYNRRYPNRRYDHDRRNHDRRDRRRHRH
jgi:hypothetical protein